MPEIKLRFIDIQVDIKLHRDEPDTSNHKDNIVEALEALKLKGINQVSSYEIAETMQELHPRKYRGLQIGYGALFRSLDHLQKEGEVGKGWIYSDPEDEKPKRAKPFYFRINKNPETPTS